MSIENTASGKLAKARRKEFPIETAIDKKKFFQKYWRKKSQIQGPLTEELYNDFRAHNGAFILLDTLVRHGVTSIFGYPGGAILPLYDELYHWENYTAINHFLVRHEQGAAHAADGYARSTGHTGVCFATSGPGATNLLTGIATAFSDSVPMIVVTGQVGRSLIGTDAFQEIDIFSMTLPISKHSYVIQETGRLLELLTESFYVAENGRQGPVVIDFPKDVGLEVIKNYEPIYPVTVHHGLQHRFTEFIERCDLDRFLKIVMFSMQPVLYVGGGAVSSDAAESIVSFANKFFLPITTTLMGKGITNDDDVLSLGMLGMHGTPWANFSVTNCDVLVAIGARFDDRVTGKLEEFGCKATIMHIDIDNAEVGKNKLPYLSIQGDIKAIFDALGRRLEKHPNRGRMIEDSRKRKLQWIDIIKEWKTNYPLFEKKETDNRFLPQEAITAIGRAAPDAFYTTDVGQHQMWCAQYINCKPRRWMSSAGLGTMGFGLPAAIGVQVANPADLVICVSGDASFQMNLQELGTIAQYKLPIKIFVVNNTWQGMVRQWQESFYEGRYSHSEMKLGAPDLMKLAETYGIKSYRFKTLEQLQKSIDKILEVEEPILTELVVAETENCYPMVEPGKSNENMQGLIIRGKMSYDIKPPTILNSKIAINIVERFDLETYSFPVL